MLSRISSELLMSISNKHDYKTFWKSPASLLNCNGNILSHSSGKWCYPLTMVIKDDCAF